MDPPKVESLWMVLLRHRRLCHLEMSGLFKQQGNLLQFEELK